MIVLPVPSLVFLPVLAELRHAHLITSEECKRVLLMQYCFSWLASPDLRADLSHVVTVQRAKSPEVMSKTADVLKRHGFGSKSRLLAGRQSRPSFISLCYVVQWSLLMTATL